MKSTLQKQLLYSTCLSDKNTLQKILTWVAEKNENLKVNITKTNLSDSDAWFYDKEKGEIRNQNNSFFQIRGLRQFCGGEMILEQPVLIQNEIGYLGIICKEIDRSEEHTSELQSPCR